MLMSTFVKKATEYGGKYSHENTMKNGKRYITVTLSCGVVLDFSLGGIYKGRYYESRLKQISYLGKSVYANESTVLINKNGFSCSNLGITNMEF